MLLLKSSLLFLCLLLPAISSSAPLNKQQLLFQQAQIALSTNDTIQFNSLNSQLKGYVLQPYLDYLTFHKNIKTTNKIKLRQFIMKHQYAYFSNRLNNKWLQHLASTKNWSLFLQNYTESSSASRQCERLQALMSTGNYQQVLTDAHVLWLVPKSQHKACDTAFNYWERKGKLTNTLRRERLMLALEKNQFKLAKYLAKSLPDSIRMSQLVSLWEKAHHSPTALLQSLPVKRHSPLSESNSFTHDIVQHAVARLAHKSTDQAFTQWQRIQKHYSFSTQEKYESQAYIGLRAALSREDRALEYFGNSPDQPWRVRAALWQQNWSEAHKAILSLSNEEQQKNIWKYWLARSKAQLGDKVTANQIYSSISHERDFYSFLASDQLKQAYKMNHNPIQLNQDELTQLSLRPEIRILKEFYTLGMRTEAIRQAYTLREKLSDRDLQLLATLTHQWGWHNQTISFLGKAKYWDALDLRFPVVFNSSFIKSSKTTRLNPSWLLAVARQESAFDLKANSRVGAKGLMQLMPQTAKLIAKKIKQPLKNMSELHNPDRNIQLGSAYLRKMFDDKQKNPVLATASYNAGPHRISKWMPKNTLPADIWIENIPFKETRKYAKSVLSYAAIFDFQRHKKVKPLSMRMPSVQPQNVVKGQW